MKNLRWTGKSTVFPCVTDHICIITVQWVSPRAPFVVNHNSELTVSEKISSIDLTKDSPASTHTPPEEDESKLSVISWNVDGLDTDNLAERARGLCSYLVL